MAKTSLARSDNSVSHPKPCSQLPLCLSALQPLVVLWVQLWQRWVVLSTSSPYLCNSCAAAQNSRSLYSTEPSIQTNCLFLSDHKKKSGFIVFFGYVAWLKTCCNARNSMQPSLELKSCSCTLQFWLTKQNNSELLLRPWHSPRKPSLQPSLTQGTPPRAWRYSIKGFEGWHEEEFPGTCRAQHRNTWASMGMECHPGVAPQSSLEPVHSTQTPLAHPRLHCRLGFPRVKWSASLLWQQLGNRKRNDNVWKLYFPSLCSSWLLEELPWILLALHTLLLPLSPQSPAPWHISCSKTEPTSRNLW